MRILEIDIYGFGKFHQTQFQFDHQLQVLFGENEAGKSTVYAFIQAVLFGFPFKSPSTPNYEPKHSHIYGGSVTLLTDAGERVKVERVRKRSGSEVNIHLPNGVVTGDHQLKIILQGLDRNFYEKIFAFNLDGLQEVYKLDENEIGKFLFYTGVTGSDQLWDTEKNLSKRLDELFKPGGRIPKLNVDLADLRDSAIALKKAQQIEGKHADLMIERNELQQQLISLENAVHEREAQFITQSERLRLAPLAIENESLSKSIQTIGVLQFPIDGQIRMKECLGKLQPQESLMLQMKQKEAGLLAEIEKLHCDTIVIEEANNIEKSFEIANKLEVIDAEGKELSIRIDHFDHNIAMAKSELHLQLTDQQLLELDTSIFVKDQIQKLVNEQERLTNKRHQLEEDLAIAKEKLAKITQVTENLSDKKLLDVDVQQFEEKLRNSAQTNSQRSNELYNQFLQSRKQLMIPMFVFCGLMLFVAILLFILHKLNLFTASVIWVVALIGLVIPVLLFRSSNHKLKMLQQQEHSNKLSTENQQLLQDMLADHHDVQEQLRLHAMRFDDVKDDLDHTQQELQQLTMTWQQNQKQRVQISSQLCLSEAIAETMLLAAFEKLCTIKQLLLEKDRENRLLIVKQSVVREQERFIETVATKLMPTFSGTTYEKARQMRVLLTTEFDNKVKLETIKSNLNVLKEEMLPVQAAIDALSLEKSKLLQLADCQEEEEYFAKASLQIELNDLKSRHRLIKIQLGNEETTFKNEAELQQTVINLTENLSDLKEKIKTTSAQLAKTEHEIFYLEETGTVERHGQDHQLHVERFLSHANEWMKLSIAKGILLKATRNFKEEKLPTIIEKAELYLAFLTENEYQKIIFNDSSGLLLLDQTGEEVFARDLSRGTAEMLYTALRFSFMHSLQDKMIMPMMIDDSFVNFDQKRNRRVLQLLEQLSAKQQILFFTCHSHNLEVFDKASILHISESQLSLF